MYKKKIKSENFVVNIDEIDVLSFQPPMLAKEFDGMYTNDIICCQPKLDGIRCNIYVEKNEVKAISRKNNPFYTVEHIKSALKDILLEYPTIHFDGELYNHDLHDDFNKVVSLVKKEKLNEEEFEILDICEGKIKGYAEYAWIKLPNDLTCKATFSYTDEECENILKEKNNLIGKWATVKFFGYTKDGKLRFPVLKCIRNYE